MTHCFPKENESENRKSFSRGSLTTGVRDMVPSKATAVLYQAVRDGWKEESRWTGG